MIDYSSQPTQNMKPAPSWEQRLTGVTFGGLQLSFNSLHLRQLLRFRQELEGKAVLVPGFANFPEAMWLATNGVHVTGIDRSLEGCAEYHRHWEGKKNSATGTLEILQGDIRNDINTFKHTRFDAVISELLIHIFPQNEQDLLLSEFRRIIKPRGLLILTALAKGDRNFPHSSNLVATQALVSKFEQEGWQIEEASEYEQGGSHSHANGDRHDFAHRIVFFCARNGT